MNRYKPLPHSLDPKPATPTPRKSPALRTKERQKGRARRRRLAHAVAQYGAELAHRPTALSIRRWLKRWWVWAASPFTPEPQPPAPEVWRLRPPQWWAAARRHMRQAIGK